MINANTMPMPSYAPDNQLSSQPTTFARLAALQKMNLEELRALWSDLYGAHAPTSYSGQQLIKRLIYRIQEIAYGGDSKETKARLEQQARRYSQSDNQRHKVTLLPGTVLTRVYQGVQHQVLVLEDGQFQHGGCKFKSLSGIAKRIAGGTSWNGWEFFGLKNRKR